MLETRSAVFKMMKKTAAEERQITKWPIPFSSEITPYVDKDFCNVVKRSCSKKSLTLRISKIIVIGDMAVGKTSLVNRFCHKLFDNNYKATIGVDFEVERFDILGVPFHVQIWDTAGQERFKCIAASYYRATNVILVVFDVGNLITLAHCQQWLAEAYKSNPDPCHVFLVGNKRDLLSNRVYDIIEKRAAEVANRIRAEYWAVSARTGDGVAELFARIAALSFNAMVLQELQKLEVNQSISIASNLPKVTALSEEEKKRGIKRGKCLDCQL